MRLSAGAARFRFERRCLLGSCFALLYFALLCARSWLWPGSLGIDARPGLRACNHGSECGRASRTAAVQRPKSGYWRRGATCVEQIATEPRGERARRLLPRRTAIVHDCGAGLRAAYLGGCARCITTVRPLATLSLRTDASASTLRLSRDLRTIWSYTGGRPAFELKTSPKRRRGTESRLMAVLGSAICGDRYRLMGLDCIDIYSLM